LWDGTNLSVDTCQNRASSPARNWPDVVPGSKTAGSIILADFDGHFYQLTIVAMERPPTGRSYPLQRSRLHVPQPRVATNPTIDQVVLFGGLADVNPNNTWTYNGTTWTLQSPITQPLLVYAASAAFDPNINAVILFGGGKRRRRSEYYMAMVCNRG